MSPPAPRTRLADRLLATAALASWPLPLWCIGLQIGAAALADTVLVVVLSVGAVSLVLRLLHRREAGDFALFFPVRSYQQGTPRSIRVIATLLFAFNLGAAWFLLGSVLSHTTTLILIVLITVSAMNLADECWIARRRRLAAPL